MTGSRLASVRAASAGVTLVNGVVAGRGR
jgi:hypothetical protein